MTRCTLCRAPRTSAATPLQCFSYQTGEDVLKMPSSKTATDLPLERMGHSPTVCCLRLLPATYRLGRL